MIIHAGTERHLEETQWVHLFQCSRQFQISNLMKMEKRGRKHCGKRKSANYEEFLLFLVFSIVPQTRQNQDLFGRGLTFYSPILFITFF